MFYYPILTSHIPSQLCISTTHSSTDILSNKTLDPYILISLIGEEFDHQKMQHSCHYGGKSKDNTTDEAMAVNPSSSKRNGGKGGARKP